MISDLQFKSMRQANLYSIRMHANAAGKHISGAERISTFHEVDSVVQDLVARARNRTNTPDEIVIHIEHLMDDQVKTFSSLDVITIDAPDMTEGRNAAVHLLKVLGISSSAAESGIRWLSCGASPSGGNMRGAIIMDAVTGERLEPDQERGIRATRFDWSEDALKRIMFKLAEIGLTHHRTREALALATKVAHAPGMIAELCWSDEPDYTAGYVASRKTGYVRFPVLKQTGDHLGGRVFFVDSHTLNRDALILYLQNEPVLINATGNCCPAVKPKAYFAAEFFLNNKPTAWMK